MKFSIVIGLNESSRSEEEIVEDFQKKAQFVKELGYDGLELAILEPEKVPVEKISEICAGTRIDISAVGTGSTYLRFGYSFGTSDQKLRAQALDRVKVYAEFAAPLNAKVILGLIRGRFRRPDTRDTALAHILESTKRCGPIADEFGVDMVMEPINGFEIDSLNTVGETAAFLAQVNHPRVKLMVDNFHVNLEESPDFVQNELPKYCPALAHVHLADTNRRAPGTGTFDYAGFLRTLKQGGYEGFLSVEPIMKPSFEEVARVSAKTILPLLRA